MTVYVDDMQAPYGRMKMCHMMADSHAELLEMADRIGVKRKWIQHEGTPREHFDVSLGMRARAIEQGAQLVHTRDLVPIMERKRLELDRTERRQAWAEAASVAPDSDRKLVAIETMVRFEESPEFEGEATKFRCCDKTDKGWLLSGITETDRKYQVGWE